MSTACSKAIQPDDHSALLHTALGAPGSGAARYAAAMHFYAQGLMSHQMLEIYRICSKLDKEDPIKVAIYEGVTPLLADKLLQPGTAR